MKSMKELKIVYFWLEIFDYSYLPVVLILFKLFNENVNILFVSF